MTQQLCNVIATGMNTPMQNSKKQKE